MVVLSNNDGCLVSRSNEIKALGLKMGSPYFKHKETLERIGAAVFSSNYALYGDMSHRVMQILAEICPRIEIYSIDEAFLDLSHLPKNQIESFAHEIQSKVLKYTAIPVSIGIAGTKTLAKVAAELAKQNYQFESSNQGVFSLLDKDLNKYLELLPVVDIWGVGRQYGKLLRSKGVNNAKDFINLDKDWVKKTMSIVGVKILRELQNINCLDLEVIPEPKKSITSSRSFGKPVFEFKELREALASHSSTVGEKLRKENLAATYISVFITTSRFDKDYYFNSFSTALEMQTDSTPELIKWAGEGLKKIFIPGKRYKKAGVLVTGLVNRNSIQDNLFLDSASRYDENKQKKLMEVMDKINRKFGQNTLKSLALGVDQSWKMLNEKRSPRYTTVWKEILKVK